MNFTIIAATTAIAGMLLGVGWLVAPRLMHTRWAISATEQSLLVGRRLGAAYLGIAIMLFLGRSAPPSELRTAVCVGMLVAMLVLAGLGLHAWRSNRVGKGILPSVILEVLLAAGYLWILLNG